MTGLVVILSIMDRVALVNVTTRAYAAMNCVDSVNVVWHDPNRVPPQWLDPKRRRMHNKSFHLHWPATNSLNNRFEAAYASGYDAALHVDDDFVLSEYLVCSTYKRWQQHNSTVFVFNPRLINFPQAQYTWDDACKKKRYNTGFVTKGSIFLTNYLRLYFTPQWKPVRDAVTKYVTGEDLLMSAVLATKRVIVVNAKGMIKTFKSTSSPLSIRSSKHRPAIMKLTHAAMRSSLVPLTTVLHSAPNLTRGHIRFYCFVY